MTFDINILAVFGAAVAAMALGALWYSPVLFGKQWMRYSGITEAQIAIAKQKGMALNYLLNFGAVLVTAYVLAHFVAVWRQLEGGMSISQGMQLGFFVWIGFIAPVMLGTIIWEGKPWMLFVLSAGYQLAAVLLMSGLLSSLT